MLELKNINKSFGLVQANKDVCLKVEKGTIHGIVGENGAGKSTLMNILYGLHPADSGEIFIENKPVNITSSKNAIELGIGMVHQHFELVDTFNTVENVILGTEKSFLLKENHTAATKKLKTLEKNYKLPINYKDAVGELPVGERQRIEIFKALYRNANILILDEPTGVLTPQEADNLFEILASLKKEKTTILLITHKLKEIMRITDNVTVMRKGSTIQSFKTAKTTPKKLAELMVGRGIKPPKIKMSKISSQCLLDVKGLNYEDSFQIPRLKNIELRLNAGEILGIAGVSGNGQSELLEILSGMTAIQTGEIKINGKIYTQNSKYNPSIARKIGVVHIPEDRINTGIIKDFSAEENNFLGYHKFKKFLLKFFLREYNIQQDCIQNMKNFDVRPLLPEAKISNFSGGNQQKLLLAREINKDTKVLLIGQPTRGVDVGAIESIHQKLLEQRNQGKAILLVSAELDEILTLSDRIMVMFHGEIVGELSKRDATSQKIGLMMTNSHKLIGNLSSLA